MVNNMTDEVKYETVDSPNDTGDEPVQTPADDGAKSPEATIKHLQEQNAKLFERAKKAEGFVKDEDGNWVKKPEPVVQPKPEPKPQSTPPTVSPEELRLIAHGMSDEEIEQVKVIAKGKGVTLPEALKDPLFVAFQKDFQEQKKKEEAKLGASKGSDEATKDEVKSGLTREEHEKLFHKKLGR